MEKETLKMLLRTWFPEWGDVVRSVLRHSLRSRGQGACIERSFENDRYYPPLLTLKTEKSMCKKLGAAETYSQLTISKKGCYQCC